MPPSSSCSQQPLRLCSPGVLLPSSFSARQLTNALLITFQPLHFIAKRMEVSPSSPWH